MTEYFLRLENIDFDADSSAEDLDYLFEGIQNLQRIKEQGRTVAAAEDAEESVSYSFTPPKVRVPIQWLMINGVNRSQLTIDKSRGTFESSGIDDQRLKMSDIVNVSTSNDTFTVNGDQKDRLTGNNTSFRVEGSSGNDGSYSVTSTSYDSNNDETTISVSQDVTDSTADGRIYDGIVTIKEQILFLRTYVFNGTGGAKFNFFGGNFTDPDGDGTDEGTPVSPENTLLNENVNNLQAQQQSIELPIAEVV